MLADDAVQSATEARLAMRRGEWTGITTHRLPGCVQCNLVVLPKTDALDFLVFCQRNPKACPVIEVTDPGNPEPRFCAPGADLRTDLARYAVYRHGKLAEEVTDIRDLWRDDLVAFLIGSSLTFDHALERAGVPRSQVWVLDTQLQTVPAGRFSGPLVVTMRWMTPVRPDRDAPRRDFSSRRAGAGDPALIGADLEHPLYGPVVRHSNEDAGVLGVATPQRVAVASKIEFRSRPGRFHHRLEGGPILLPDARRRSKRLSSAAYPIPTWLAALPSTTLRDAVLVVLKTQELAGLDVIADGELSRFDVNHPETNGMIDYFIRPMTGIHTSLSREELAKFRTAQGMKFRTQPAGVVRGAIGEGNLNLPAAWQSVKGLTTRPLKFTLTSPYMLAKTR